MPKYIIRDLVCSQCGTVADDQMVLGITLPVLHPCTKCKVDTEQTDTGTNPGGKNKRYRFADIPEDPRAYRGQVRIGPPKAERDGSPQLDADGNAIHDGAKFSEDARDEKRDRIYHETDTKRGTRPLHFDQKKGDE